MTDPQLEKDLKSLLAALQGGPKTSAELSAATRLSANRIRSLLLHLQTQGQVHAPHFVPNRRGQLINLWELRQAASPIV